MRNVVLYLSFSVSLVLSQTRKEVAPNPDDYLHVSNDIELGAAIEAPRATGSLRGIQDHMVRTRTPESVFEEVRQNQSRLSYLYKIWKFKDPKGVGSRKFSLSLTINQDGDVQKAVVKGPTNAAFIKDVHENIRTWSFSKVKEKRPFEARLKNLDFLFRNELAME